MIKARCAAKVAKLEKPRPLRSLNRTISDPGNTHSEVFTSMEGGSENGLSGDIAKLNILVQYFEGGLKGVDKILDLCQLLHNKGKMLDKIYPEGLQRCFSVIKTVLKQDCVSTDLRRLLLELIALKANRWEQCDLDKSLPIPSPQKQPVRKYSVPVFSTQVSQTKDGASDETIELNVSIHNPVELKWNASGHMWHCELVLPSDKVERVRGNTKHRAKVLEVLKNSRMIISKDEVWNHRQVALLGKKNEIRKAAKLILEVMNLSSPDNSVSIDKFITNGDLSSDLSNVSDLAKNNTNNSNCNLTDGSSQLCRSPDASRNTANKNTQVEEYTTVDEEIQTETDSQSYQPLTPTKWEQQSLLQFSQGTLCLCAQDTDKAVLVEAKEVLKDYFYSSSKQNVSYNPNLHDGVRENQSQIKRRKSYEDRSASFRRQSTEVPYIEVTGSKSDMGLSTPDKFSNSLHAPNRSGKSEQTSPFNSNKSDSLLDENQFTQHLMDQLKLPEHKGVRVSSSTPEGTPDASPVSDCSVPEPLKPRVQTLRQPIIAGSHDKDEIDNSIPGVLYTPKGRRAMFKQYSDQVLKAQLGFPSNYSNNKERVSYSRSDLLSCANSTHAKIPPGEWSYLRKVFPEVCLENVDSYFNPAEDIDPKVQQRQMSFFHTPSRFDNRSYAIENQHEESLSAVEDTARDP